MVCLISCLRSWGMSLRWAMSRILVRGTLEVKASVKLGSLHHTTFCFQFMWVFCCASLPLFCNATPLRGLCWFYLHGSFLFLVRVALMSHVVLYHARLVFASGMCCAHAEEKTHGDQQ